MTAAGLPVPQYVTGTFLLDTGASGTCVDPGLVAPLGLTPTGNVQMQTPSTAGTPVTCSLFDISMYIPGTGQTAGFMIEAIPVIEAGLRAQGIDGLLGRDVLDRCTFICNGSAGMFTLAY